MFLTAAGRLGAILAAEGAVSPGDCCDVGAERESDCSMKRSMRFPQERGMTGISDTIDW